MLFINDHPDSNVIETLATEKLDAQDYNRLMPIIKEKVEKYGKIRWLFEVRQFKGWTADAIFKDTFIDIKYIKNFEKIAIVGEKKWHQVMSNLLSAISPSATQYFDAKDKDIALKWINKP